MRFFDLQLTKIYRFYIKYGEKDVPAYLSVLLLSLFQSFNLLSIIFIGISLTKGKFSYTNFQIILTMLPVLIFNLVRLSRIGGVEKLNQKFKDSELQSSLNPIVYFVLSLAILILLRIVGWFPL
ncbi:MAG: hypothetical protein C5B52_07835 [Bacteroidetes bacterium]|nr:MAG: hypothetical protein C5B52_07835 [Bacteroidota bacterium]